MKSKSKKSNFNSKNGWLGFLSLHLRTPREFAKVYCEADGSVVMDASVLMGLFPEGYFFLPVASVLKKMLAGGQLVLAIGFNKTKSSLSVLAMINLRFNFKS